MVDSILKRASGSKCEVERRNGQRASESGPMRCVRQGRPEDFSFLSAFLPWLLLLFLKRKGGPVAGEAVVATLT